MTVFNVVIAIIDFASPPWLICSGGFHVQRGVGLCVLSIWIWWFFRLNSLLAFFESLCEWTSGTFSLVVYYMTLTCIRKSLCVCERSLARICHFAVNVHCLREHLCVIDWPCAWVCILVCLGYEQKWHYCGGGHRDIGWLVSRLRHIYRNTNYSDRWGIGLCHIDLIGGYPNTESNGKNGRRILRDMIFLSEHFSLAKHLLCTAPVTNWLCHQNRI